MAHNPIRQPDMRVARHSSSMPAKPICMACMTPRLELVVIRFTDTPGTPLSRRDEQAHLCERCLRIAHGLLTKE